MFLAIASWLVAPTGVVLFLTLAAFASSGLAWRLARRSGELRSRNQTLEAQLVDLRLCSLKRALGQHFLLNTLHMISSLMHEDLDRADTSMANLADMLRTSLKNSERSEISLDEELAHLERYLAITRARFGSRVRTDLAIDPECLTALVPELLLQPLVENSVRHVVAKASFPHLITVEAKRVDDRLRLEVHDDGPGAPGLDSGRFEEGVGLTVTRRRLQLHFADDHRFEVGNGSSCGFNITMDLPFRTQESSDHPDDRRRRRAAGA